jgi:putative ABC transport system permease protein
LNELLGIPMGTLMRVFIAGLVIVLVLSAFMAFRQPVLFRLGARNIPRRWGRSLLIVLGLTLATTIITAALATGDTLSSTARTGVLVSLGNIDEVIASREAGDVALSGEAGQLEYFEAEAFQTVRAALAGSQRVDGVMPAIWEDVGVQNLTGLRTEPRVRLMGIDAAHVDGFGSIRGTSGQTLTVDMLRDGEVFLNRDAADELSARPGHELVVYGGVRPETVVVREIIEYRGTGTTGPGLLMPLDRVQELFGRPGQIKQIFISNTGDAASGARHSDAVIEQIGATVADLGLTIEASKQEALRLADEAGASFGSFFVTFGSFSIAAGVMLIFLLFVMLAGERKPEMGVARAVGAERVHLIQMFMFEGLIYNLIAATLGVVLGIAVGYVMISMLGTFGDQMGFEVGFAVTGRSLATAYTMGVVLTFIVVTVSAWRVSVLNIVSAVRNLPEPASEGRGRSPLLWAALGLAAGVLLVWAGLNSEQGMPFYLGVSLLILAGLPLLRWFGAPDRLAFTLVGSLTAVWWLLPEGAVSWLTGDLSMDFTMFVVGGLITVGGATWVVMYNSDVLLGFSLALFGRIRQAAPILKMAITYPLMNRFRTGVTLAMFTLVVFTLVMGGTMITAFTEAFNDTRLYGGGFDMRASTLPASPVQDPETSLRQTPGVSAADIEVVSSQSFAVMRARQSDTQRDFATYFVRGLDDAFLANTTYGLAAIADGYSSASEVWQALRSDPTLAVVDGLVAPRRGQFALGVPVPDFQLTGFYVEDRTFAPVPIEVQDPATGAIHNLTVIGVLQDVTPEFMIGVSASQRFVETALPTQAQPFAYLVAVREGADMEAMAASLEAEFLSNGMAVSLLKDELADLVAINRTMNYVVQGFLGLGLVVGVAALGVISARSVVERRQEIGVMRAVGFEQGMVRLSFLIEASIVAVAGMVLGSGLALILAFNVIQDIGREPSWENLSFAVPWVNLAVIFAIVYGASLVTAFLPAHQASRVYPAEALRYE